MSSRAGVETFAEARSLVPDPAYEERRRRSITELDELLSTNSIDEPIADLMRRFARIPCCFTIQSCCGHFVTAGGREETIMKSVLCLCAPDSVVRYRIAYVAFCVQNDPFGRSFLNDLRSVQNVGPDYIQFGSAGWFWDRCANSYVLQVEPDRYVSEDSCEVSVSEAVHSETIRDKFLSRLDEVIGRHIELQD
ncbi:MAG: hypothetical protein JSV90_09340 [Methanobacteriota archaeon]|nr:MAG: hypothetical protein JSV90_09340 [Euryarchaeota archaeon]